MKLVNETGIGERASALAPYMFDCFFHRPSVGRHEVCGYHTRTPTHPLDTMDQYTSPPRERVVDERRRFPKMCGELLERLISYRYLQHLRERAFWKLHCSRHDGEYVGDTEGSICCWVFCCVEV